MTSRGQVRLDIYEKALKEVESGTPLKQVVRSHAHTGLKRSSLQRYRKKVTALGSQSVTMGYHKGVPHVQARSQKFVKGGLFGGSGGGAPAAGGQWGSGGEAPSCRWLGV